MLQNKLLLLSLLVIFLLGLFFRVYRLSNTAPILNRDEAALGYNAMLLKETGRDEWGINWPITPKSFGDSKLIGYPLLLVGLFQFLPQADWVVRLPAIIAGSLLSILVYFFSRQLGLTKSYSLLVALSIAVNPVFIHFSRFAYEAMVALTYFVAATILILFPAKRFKRRLVLDLVAAFLYFASLLTYNTPLLLLPLLILLIPIQRGLLPISRWLNTVGILILTWIIALLLLFPMLAQKSGISIFSDQTYIQAYPQYRASFNTWLQPFLGNQYVYYGKSVLMQMFKSYSAHFIVTDGGTHPWHTLSKYGHLSWIIYFGFLIGLISYWFNLLIRGRKLTKNNHFLMLLLIVTLIPSSITVDAPHATRSLLFFVIVTIVAIYGYQQLTAQIRWSFLGRFNNRLFLLGLLIATLISGLSFFNQYLENYPSQATRVYQAGFDQTITALDVQYPNSNIAVVDPGGFQYILLAWYAKYSPAEFFQSIVKQQPNTIGLQYGERLGRYHFIMQAADQSPTENILLFWNDSTNQWQYLQS